MAAETFDRLTLLRRTGLCANGWAEVCRDEAGQEIIRLCIAETGLQRSLLWDKAARMPARMQGERLELLLPLAQGQTLAEWLGSRRPDLALRREVCLQLLAELLAHPVPPALLALSAWPENLRLGRQTAGLAWFPRLDQWEPGLGSPQAVQAVSRLMAEILTCGYGEQEQRRFPLELRLVVLRAGAGDYADWQALQQDLADLTGELAPRGWLFGMMASRLRARVPQLKKTAAKAAVGLLAAAALLALLQAAQARQSGWQKDWPGLARVWEQEWGEEEAG